MADTTPGGLIAFQSDRVEELVDKLVVELVGDERRGGRGPTAGPFREHLVVIPTRNLETYLSFEVAARRGVAAGLKFLTAQQFMELLLPVDDVDDLEVRLLDHGAITRLVLALLEDPSTLERAELEPVRRFIFSAPNAPQHAIDQRKFQLAARVAHLFEEYGYARQNILQHWREGKPALKREYPERASAAHFEIERWQMALWQAIFGEDGRALRVEDDDGRPWMTLPEAVYHYAGGDQSRLNWPEAVHFFSHSYLTRFFRDLLSTRTYAEDGRICLYVMTPSLESWSDGVAGDRDEDPVFEILADESPLEGDEYPLALEVWGRAGRDYQRMIDFIAYDREDVSVIGERPNLTLLHEFQAVIREMKTARDVFAERDLPDDKKSLNFWSCASIQRECEAVASEIWEMVRTHDDLRFNDIAVVVQPGERSLYQAHLEAAFEQSGGIPCNIIDVEGSQISPFLEAARLLLAMPLGKFRRSELLALLIHPNTVANYPEADQEAWQQWCQELNIFQGADKSDLDETYLEGDRFTWRQGMNRLVLGAFMSQPQGRQVQALELGDGKYLPHETNHQDLDTVAVLTVIVDEIIDWARAARSQRKTMSKWMDDFSERIYRHLEPRDRREERTRMAFLGALGRIGDTDPCPDEDVSYRVAFEYALTAMAEIEESRGQYLADGVVVSAFKPMRPIPFEVVFVTGLGEGKFPAPDPPDMLDLRRVKSEEHDVNPRYRDQYMFLETIVSTRSRLYLSWVGRHGVTGDPLEPASVVHQLREMVLEMSPRGTDDAAEKRLALEERVEFVEHPLRRYDDCYFPQWAGDGVEEEVIAADGVDAIPARAEPDGSGRSERLWPNHHREARREARVRALRRRLNARLPAGYEPTMQELKEALEEGPFMRIADLLAWTPPEGADGAVERDRVVLQIGHLRRFLQCPLQGSAQVVLSIFSEDDDDALDVDHEPFQAEFLTRLFLVRRALEAALVDGDLSEAKLEQAFDERARAAEMAGDLPSGMFYDAERDKCLGLLRRYAGAIADEAGQVGRLRRLRLGAASEDESVDEIFEPIQLDVQVGERSLAVEIHGAVDLLEDGGGRTLVIAAGAKAKPKYIVQGGLEQVVLRAAGVESTGRTTIIGSKGKAEDFDVDAGTADDARQYLADLSAELLGGVHDYFFPVELASDLLAGKAADLPQAAESKKQPGYNRDVPDVSSVYGPVRRWADAAPPSEEEARRILKGRYAPFLRAWE